MLSGGVFAFNASIDDIFICSDGVDMNQKELLNIARGVMSLLHTSPLGANGRKVLFIEAASTLIQQYKGYTFGVSTYHQQSIPLLCSMMARVLSVIKTIFPSELNLTSHHSRSQFFHAISHLYGTNQGILPSNAVDRALNSVDDVGMKIPGSYRLNPTIEGEFEFSHFNLDDHVSSEFISSALDSSSITSQTGPDSSIIGELPVTGTLDLSYFQEVSFRVHEGSIVDGEYNTKIEAKAICQSDMGGVQFKLNGVEGSQIQANPQVLTKEDEYYVCATPKDSLSETLPIVVIDGAIQAEEKPPFQVKFEVMQSETHAKYIVRIACESEMAAIKIGVDAGGINAAEAASGDSQLSVVGGETFLLEPPPIGRDGGATVASVFGPLARAFERPATVTIQAALPGQLFVYSRVALKAGSNFLVGKNENATFVQRSVWSV